MSSYPPQALWACIEPPSLPMPMVEGSISAGFPSPADDFAVKRLDLNDLITHPLATFYWKTSGRSMIEAGIDDGDILVVNRALVPAHLNIVVAQALRSGWSAIKRALKKSKNTKRWNESRRLNV